MTDRVLDPSGNMYESFMQIINAITIKYFYKAQEYETMESKLKADGYLSAINKTDTFFSYSDYTASECRSVGINETSMIDEIVKGNINIVPAGYREPLLLIRRQREIDLFEEQNNYYRMLNGLPDIEDNEYFSISSSLAMEYDIDINIPIHRIQDYYNKKEQGKGDYLISIIEGSGYIDRLIESNPDKYYLKYIGSNRISLYTARSAKNFQIIQVKKIPVRQSILDVFIRVYEQCREYYVKTIYVSSYNSVIDNYDNFIAMCIMIMTMQQVAIKQIPLGIKRDFFDIYAIRTLYEAYDIPFNINIDEDTQADLVQNLNMLIQNKATDKVIYNISNLLGFTNVDVYKYYLIKEHKMDIFDTPIFKYKERFNSDTGSMEVVPDYEAMYDLYFQKYKLTNNDYANALKDKTNRVDYESVVSNDAFWWEDQHVYDRLWKSEYNFVESKYLSLGISYSMTEIMFENVLFLKLIMREHEEFKNLRIKLPRILENQDIPIFDVIILLLCLTSAKHKLWGEIITVPTQVISVVDYINNTDRGGAHHDTFTFNFNYFFNPKEFEDKDKINEMKESLIEHINNLDKDELIGNTFEFNFDYFSLNNKDREKNIEEIKKLIGEEDYEKFLYYVEKVSIVKEGDNTEKIRALNDMFASIKSLYKLINFYMTKTNNKEVYESLKRIYYSLFVSKEMTDIFTISTEIIDENSGESNIYTRTAWTYFEYLYHRNPKLYNSIFEFDINKAYDEYILNHPDESSMSINTFSDKIAKGEIFVDYGKLIDNESNESIRNETIYFYVNHIISRLEMVIEDLKFMYTMNDTATPLETLLVQLVRFFKSYTVDMLGLDTLFICDFKLDNMIKLIDKIHYIEKTIGIDIHLHFSHSDVINRITSIIDPKDRMEFIDRMMYISTLLIDEMHGNRNSIRLNDLVSSLNTTYTFEDRSFEFLEDYININSDIDLQNKCNLKDKIYKLWYTE